MTAGTIDRFSRHLFDNRLRDSADYYRLLDHFHRHLLPRTYVEIGVASGKSASLALPGTTCVGIDPEPRISWTLPKGMKLVPTTSREFFDSHDLLSELGNTPLDLAYVDGSHWFGAAYDDVVQLAGYANDSTVVLMHDCLPTDDEIFERVDPGESGIWSGGVWKVILALKDLESGRLAVRVVDVAPTGLGVLTGLNTVAEELSDRRDELLAKYRHLPIHDLRDVDTRDLLNVHDNDWDSIRSWLPAESFRHDDPSALASLRAKRALPQSAAMSLRRLGGDAIRSVRSGRN